MDPQDQGDQGDQGGPLAALSAPLGGPLAPATTTTKTTSEISTYTSASEIATFTSSSEISTFTISFTVPSTGSFTATTLGSSTGDGNGITSPTRITTSSMSQSETPSSTLSVNVSVSVEVSVTATLSVHGASQTAFISNRPFPSSPAGAIASTSNNGPLTAVAGIAVGISTFLLLAIFILALLWYYQRKRRREANNSATDSWANSFVQPEVVRAAGPSIRRTPVPRTPNVPNMNLGVPPLPPPTNPFLSADESAALVGFAPSARQVPQRAPSRRSFRGELGEMPARYESGNSGPNRSMWRRSSDLTPPTEVPEPPYDDPTALPPMPQRGQQSETMKMNPLGQNPPSPNVRVTGRRPSSRNLNTPIDPEGQDLPESLGRLNQWLEDNRRRSRI